LGAYTAAVSALQAAVATGKNNLPGLKASPADEVAAFVKECAKKNAVPACGGAVTDVGTPSTTNVPTFVSACEIDSPTADASDCYTTYDTLIKALEALKPPGPKISLKDTGAQLDAFVTKCPKTAHSTTCLPVLSAFDTTTGPGYTDLQSIQKSCNVPDPNAETNNDGSLITFSPGSVFLMLISFLIHLQFLN
jgi:hypothetical protein